jgi:hypothetical protein
MGRRHSIRLQRDWIDASSRHKLSGTPGADGRSSLCHQLAGALGLAPRRKVFRSPVWWAGGLMLGGIAVTTIGVRLNVLG